MSVKPCGTCGGGVVSNPLPKIESKLLNEAIQWQNIEVVNGQPVYKPKAITIAKIEFK